ncbi:hypothetical protein CBL_10469 [Carabus blaptoides fortunei]
MDNNGLIVLNTQLVNYNVILISGPSIFGIQMPDSQGLTLADVLELKHALQSTWHKNWNYMRSGLRRLPTEVVTVEVATIMVSAGGGRFCLHNATNCPCAMINSEFVQLAKQSVQDETQSTKWC